MGNASFAPKEPQNDVDVTQEMTVEYKAEWPHRCQHSTPSKPSLGRKMAMTTVMMEGKHPLVGGVAISGGVGEEGVGGVQETG